VLAAGDGLLTAADSVRATLTPELGGIIAKALMGMESSAVSVEFAKSMESLTSAPPYYLPTLADQYEQLAGYTQTSRARTAGAELTIVRFVLSNLIGRLLLHLLMTEVMSIGIQEAIDAIGQVWLSLVSRPVRRRRTR
jgi:hypothetical protein